MPKKPTAEDAQIIMRLYDLRREAGNAQSPQPGMRAWSPAARTTFCRCSTALRDRRRMPGFAR